MRAGTCATSSRSSPEVPSATQTRCRHLAVLFMFSTCSTPCCTRRRALCQYLEARSSCIDLTLGLPAAESGEQAHPAVPEGAIGSLAANHLPVPESLSK